MRMVQKVRSAGSGTTTDTKTERKGSGFGAAVIAGRAGLVTLLKPACACSFSVWAVCGA